MVSPQFARINYISELGYPHGDGSHEGEKKRVDEYTVKFEQ